MKLINIILVASILMLVMGSGLAAKTGSQDMRKYANQTFDEGWINDASLNNTTLINMGQGANITIDGGCVLGASTEGMVNVKGFGAVGDGVTNDTDAILAAYTATPVGGKLYFPVGFYKYVGNINMSKSSTSLVGDSVMGSILYNYGDETGINMTASYCRLENLYLYGDGGSAGDGIRALGANSILRDVIVGNQGRHGIYIGTDAAGVTNTNMWRLENVYSKSNGGDGMYVNNPSGVNVNGGIANGLQLDNNGGDGLHLGASSLNQYNCVVAQSNGKIGINVSSGGALNTILAPDAESNTVADIVFQSGSSSNYLLANPSQGTSYTDLGANLVDVYSGVSRYTNGMKWDITPSIGFRISNAVTLNLLNTSTAIDNWNAITISDSPQSASLVRGSTSIVWKGAGGTEVADIKVYHNRGYGSISNMTFEIDNTVRATLNELGLVLTALYANTIKLVDSTSAPVTVSGYAALYVDVADGDLKVKFGDGTVKVLATDT